MKKLILSTLLLALLAPLSSVNAKLKSIRVETEEDFINRVVGVEFGNKVCPTLTFNRDKTITGICNNKKLTGTWQWTTNLVCRSVSVGDNKLPRDCQKIELEDDVLRVTRNHGNGKYADYYKQ